MNNLTKQNKVMPISKIVLYFSGTGNSYYVAKTVAQRIGADLKPIILLKKGEVINAGLVCFVFPVYDFSPPKKVSEIVSNLFFVNSNYVIAISTYGIALSKALIRFKKTLKQKDVTLSSGYGIKMPHNAVGSIVFTEEDDKKTIAMADEKIEDVIKKINEKTIGNIERSTIFEGMTIIKQFPKVMKLIFILIFKGAKALEFQVTSDCVSCYQCQKLCPVENIDFIDGKPMFKDNCTGCFACIQWCPESAIHIGKYSFEEIALKHYHHPNLVVNDLVINRLD
jgi:ferredoxin